MSAQNADCVAADLSLLWQAARVSPHLKEAVERVETEVNALRSLVSWATDSNVVLAAGTPAEVAAARRAYGWGRKRTDEA